MGNSSENHQYLVCGDSCSRPETLVWSKNLKELLLAHRLSMTSISLWLQVNFLWFTNQALYDLAPACFRDTPLTFSKLSLYWTASSWISVGFSGFSKMYLLPFPTLYPINPSRLYFLLTSVCTNTASLPATCWVSCPFMRPLSLQAPSMRVSPLGAEFALFTSILWSLACSRHSRVCWADLRGVKWWGVFVLFCPGRGSQDCL